MKAMNVKEIVRAVDGDLLCGDENTLVTSVTTDNRDLVPGALFVPIIGERVDAHRFIPSAFEAGAAAVFTQEHDFMQSPKACIRVADTQQALQKLAAFYRSRFPIPVIGITGSVGKTSTKEMVASVLSVGKNVLKTAGNFNSQIGLPLTMFRIGPEHEAAVIEMGMSNFGEMARLSAIARPQRAIVTNIGISHMEHLHTQENIRTEKLHIADYFDENGVLYLNGDDPLLWELKGKTGCREVFFGLGDGCDCRACDVQSDGERTWFHLNSTQGELLEIPVIGNHNVANALAAIAVATDLGYGMEQIRQGLLQYQGIAMRQQIHRLPQICVIDDSYNASPDSAKSGVNVLIGLKSGRRIAVLADMLELGKESDQAHYDLGRYAAISGVDLVLAVGEEARRIVQGARDGGIPAEHFENNQQVEAYLASMLRPGDAVLVKGSRGMHTDEIVSWLLSRYQSVPQLK